MFKGKLMFGPEGSEGDKVLAKHRATDTSQGVATTEYARYYSNVPAKNEKNA